MQRKPLIIPVFLLALALAAGVPAAARADQPSERERAERMAKEAIEQLMRALELMIQSIPQYEMPELNEHGDIIIRRKRPKERREPGPPEIDETTT
jgi:hypothetical protein